MISGKQEGVLAYNYDRRESDLDFWTADEVSEFFIGELVKPFFPTWVVVVGTDHFGEHGTFAAGKSLWLLMPIVVDEVLFGLVSSFGDIAVMEDVKVFDSEGVSKEFLGFAAGWKSTFLNGWVLREGIFEVERLMWSKPMESLIGREQKKSSSENWFLTSCPV